MHDFPDASVSVVDVGPRQARQLLRAQSQADRHRQRGLGARRVPAPRARDAEYLAGLRRGENGGPDRCVWASDWPHPISVVQPPNDADLLELFYRYAPDQAKRQKILVTIRRSCLGFRFSRPERSRASRQTYHRARGIRLNPTVSPLLDMRVSVTLVFAGSRCRQRGMRFEICIY